MDHVLLSTQVPPSDYHEDYSVLQLLVYFEYHDHNNSYFCRCGMVFLDPGELKWKPYFLTWLSNFPVELQDTVKVR